MKKMAIVLAVAVAAFVSAQAQTTAQKLNANQAKISLADARSRIDKAIESPQVMRAIMKHLSAEDQKLFLAEVNKAIADLPASARFGRFFTANGSSAPIEIFTILGRYSRPALPSGYLGVEYIRSGTLQYGYIIDTGYVHLRQTRIECVADVEKTPPKYASGGNLGWAALFGSRLGLAWTPAGGYAFFALDDKATSIQ